MTVPRQLTDRLVVVSRADYVRMLDDDPRPLRDDQVTVVPVPLIGGWMDVAELRDLDLVPGMVMVRDPQDPSAYVSIQEAARISTKAKCHLLFRVCQDLGASSMNCSQLSSYRSSTEAANTFTAGVTGRYERSGRAPQSAPDRRLATARSLSATLDHEVREQLDTTIRTAGRWSGGAPDVAAARAEVDRFPGPVDADLKTLIDMRDDRANPIRSFTVHVEFCSELNRSLSLLAEFTDGVEASLGRDAAKARTTVTNSFELKRAAAEKATFAIEVAFP